MLTTKHQLGGVLMELARQMRRRRLVLRAKWLPRLRNEEADTLTNLDFRHFNPDKRILVDLDTIQFGVLRELFEVGEDYVKESEAARAKEKARKVTILQEAAGGGSTKAKKLKAAGTKLRERDPW